MINTPTKLQLKIALALGINISDDTEEIAAARIRQYVAPAIHENAYDEPATGKQIAFAQKLGIDVSDETKGIASAKISQELDFRNIAALEKLELKHGDRVRQRHSSEIDGEDYVFYTEHIVSSITESGRVFFKGIGCQSAWPTQLEKITEQSPPPDVVEPRR